MKDKYEKKIQRENLKALLDSCNGVAERQRVLREYFSINPTITQMLVQAK